MCDFVGRITAHKLRTENLLLKTVTGDVICLGQLQGNIKISSEKGAVVAEKRFVGPNVAVRRVYYRKILVKLH